MRLVAWESTAACNLACVHCRAEAKTDPDPGELDTAEVKTLVRDIASMPRTAPGPLIFIISGGEPLVRPDVFEIAAYSSACGLHTVVGTNGTLLDRTTVKMLLEARVAGLSVSLDGPGPETHDEFRAVPGAFEDATRGLAEARRQGLPFQINTTVTGRTARHLPAMLEKAVELGASTWDVFMLVPTGRGASEAGVSAADYERILAWVAEKSVSAPIQVKVTCGPHYARVWRRRVGTEGGHPARASLPGRAGPPRPPTGCLAGDGFCFVSRVGDVNPCGYLPVSAGNVRERSFSDIYASSPVLGDLRDPGRLGGKCGRCEYGEVCRGCRARAFSMSGDYLAEEPLCLWKPRTGRPPGVAAPVDGVARG